MNRRGLLGSLMSLLSAYCVSAKSSPDTNPPVGLIDENGRYLSMPAVGTTVFMIRPPFGDFSAMAAPGVVVRGSSECVHLVCEYGPRQYFSDGQVLIKFHGRVVYFHREPLFVTAEASFKHKYSDFYPSACTQIGRDAFMEKFDAS